MCCVFRHSSNDAACNLRCLHHSIYRSYRCCSVSGFAMHSRPMAEAGIPVQGRLKLWNSCDYFGYLSDYMHYFPYCAAADAHAKLVPVSEIPPNERKRGALLELFPGALLSERINNKDFGCHLDGKVRDVTDR